MRLDTLLDICKSYSKLGWAVQEQLDSILDDMGTLGDQNPNALKIIIDFLNNIAAEEGDEAGRDAEQYAGEIKEFLDNPKTPEDDE